MGEAAANTANAQQVAAIAEKKAMPQQRGGEKKEFKEEKRGNDGRLYLTM
ncbi:MAG: hypothetical protein ACHP6J_04725 [Burkholderiales bacterium]